MTEDVGSFTFCYLVKDMWQAKMSCDNDISGTPDNQAELF